MFGNAGREHMEKYGTTAKQYAMIGEKNHRHSVNNPYAQFRQQYTLEQVAQCSGAGRGCKGAVVWVEGAACSLAACCLLTCCLLPAACSAAQLLP